jgi:hypothetical protein
LKTILFFLVTATAFSANAVLESFYGRVSQSGFNYTCTYKNTTDSTLDMKYVVFDVEFNSGESFSPPIQERIDRTVRSGNRISASAEIIGAYTVQHCRFLAR